jgi:SAM-dependent methyltransferase
MIFGKTYAGQYDRFYANKDYSKECDLIEQAFKNFGTGKIRSLLDFGCGAGNHALCLAKRGYQITGVDLSPSMLAAAGEKSKKARLDINWIEGDCRNVKVGRTFDAVLFMFSVLGYLPENKDVMGALGNARKHIKKNGLLLFDVWYGPAVLSIKPSDRTRIIPVPDGKIIRAVTANLDTRHHLARLHFHLWHLTGKKVNDETEESHTVRYFFPKELELMLNQSNFDLISLSSFPTLDQPADETTWNVFVVAKAT